MDTECDVDRSAGRGFNLSALYALLPLVHNCAQNNYYLQKKRRKKIPLGIVHDWMFHVRGLYDQVDGLRVRLTLKAVSVLLGEQSDTTLACGSVLIFPGITVAILVEISAKFEERRNRQKRRNTSLTCVCPTGNTFF